MTAALGRIRGIASASARRPDSLRQRTLRSAPPERVVLLRRVVLRPRPSDAPLLYWHQQPPANPRSGRVAEHPTPIHAVLNIIPWQNLFDAPVWNEPDQRSGHENPLG